MNSEKSGRRVAEQPDISIVVPYFNQPEQLAHALNDLCGQKRVRLEVLVVDDASKFSCDEVVSRARSNGLPVTVLHQPERRYTLAALISRLTGCEVRSYTDPRKEEQENGLIVENNKFRNLGLSPVTLTDGLMSEVRDVVDKYRHRCGLSKILCTSMWTEEQALDTSGSPFVP